MANKLYTEFEVKFAMDIARCQPKLTFDEVLEQLTPIQLPSDEEIEEQAHKVRNELFDEFYSYTDGAKWLRDKLLNQK